MKKIIISTATIIILFSGLLFIQNLSDNMITGKCIDIKDYFPQNYTKENQTFNSYLNNICKDNPNMCDSLWGFPSIQTRGESNKTVTGKYGWDPSWWPDNNYQMKSDEQYLMIINDTKVLVK